MVAITSLLGLVTLALTTFTAAQSAQKAGYAGTLSSLDGGLGGTVTVIDDKTLMITNYKLEDASAPALYWWGATNTNLKGGFRISSKQVTEAAKTNTLTITLDAGKTTADFSTVGLWCEKFSANFGQAELKAGGASGGGGSGATTSAPAAPAASKPSAAANTVGSTSVVGALAAAALLAVLMA
jgi:hypothetical protein